jgi:hypothetical protein
MQQPSLNCNLCATTFPYTLTYILLHGSVRLLHGSVPLLCVLQHGLVYYVHFFGSLNELVCAPCCQG